MHSKYFRAVALGTLVAAASPVAQAQTGFYVFGTIGGADHGADAGTFNATYGLANPNLPGGMDVANLSDSGAAYKLGLGYRINPHLAIEGAWGRLGKIDYVVTRPGVFGGTFRHQVEPEVLTLSVVGIWPVNREFEVYGKAGIASIDNKGSITQTGGIPAGGPCVGGLVCQPGSTSNDTVGVFGIGANYTISPGLFVRGEIEYYSSYKVGNAPDLRPAFGPFAQAGGDIKNHSWVYTIGLGYRF